MRLAGVALCLANGLVLVGASMAAPPAPSYVDAFKSGRQCETFRAHPEFVWLETIGSEKGIRHERLADELMASLGTLQEMMGDAGATREEIVELRISATSEAYRREVAALISATPELSGLPFTYEVVDGFTVKWARVGVDAVLSSADAIETIARKYGVNVGPDCQRFS
jgi:hypothetical protein